MSAGLRVLDPGARTMVQDTGFRGGLAMGVPASGVLDAAALALVNALAGNPAPTEALEVALTPPRLRAEGGPVRLATSGLLTGVILHRDGRRTTMPPWTAATLPKGAELRLTLLAPTQSALLAIAGGVGVPRFLGSRSTLPGAGLGGWQGRALQAGDLLPVRATGLSGMLSISALPPPDHGPIRVVAGPQQAHFTDQAFAVLTGSAFTVGAQTDRMGMRLDGPVLAHSDLGADIVSDGVVPGAVQVPANGQPIILLAEAQTTGGYAKIATVIRADLPRLAALMPGDAVRFTLVSVAQAEAAARAAAAARQAAIDSIAALAEPSDPAHLLALNLVGGAVDAAAPDHFDHALQGELP